MGRLQNFFDKNGEDAVYTVSKEDFLAIMASDLSVIDRSRFANMSWDGFAYEAINADGYFFYGDGAHPNSGRMFNVEGFPGTYYGSDINYYVIGAKFQAYGMSTMALSAGIIRHNINDIASGKPFFHNLGQAFGVGSNVFGRAGCQYYERNY